MRVKARAWPTYATTGLPASGVSALGLELLDVCTSPISHDLVEVVATMLIAGFPNLHTLSCGWEWPEEVGEDYLEVELTPEEQSSLDGWEKVEQMVREHRAS